MKTPFIFCYLLFHITCCVFAFKAESTAGLILGHLAVIVSMAILVKNILSRIFS